MKALLSLGELFFEVFAVLASIFGFEVGRDVLHGKLQMRDKTFELAVEEVGERGYLLRSA